MSNENLTTIWHNKRKRVGRATAVFLFLLLFGLVMGSGAGTAVAEPEAPMAAISLSAPYAQNFDTLATSGTTNTWTNDSTIPGWYSNLVSYRASAGTDTTGALYSFGTGTSSERALGSIASGGTGTIYYGVRLVNDTSNVITALRVNYRGEQWRNGGNTTPQQLTFAYQIGATVDNLIAGTWTNVSPLNFTGPIATATAGALDGNAAANRVAISYVIPLNIPAGHEIMLRWTDLNDAGNDHGLAIDDVAISATEIANLTPNTVPAWLSPGWQFWAHADVGFGNAVCVEVHPVGDPGNYVRSRCEYNDTDGPDGSNWKCEIFTSGVPAAFQNAAIEYQFLRNDWDAGPACPGSDWFTGFNWTFNTGPTAVSLSTFSASPSLPLLLLVVVGLLVGGTATLLRRR